MSTTEEVSDKRSSMFKGGMTKCNSTRENDYRHTNGMQMILKLATADEAKIENWCKLLLWVTIRDPNCSWKLNSRRGLFINSIEEVGDAELPEGDGLFEYSCL